MFGETMTVHAQELMRVEAEAEGDGVHRIDATAFRVGKWQGVFPW